MVKKIISLDLSNLLTARALAGTNYYIATCCFTLIEQNSLKDI